MQLDDLQSDGSTHALDLMELSFLDDDRKGLGAGLDGLGRQAVQAIVKDDAIGKALAHIRWDIAFDDGIVYLVHVFLGRRNAMGPGPIIGDEQKARRIFIEAAYGKKAGSLVLAWQEADDRWRYIVFRRRHDAGWLVEHEINILFIMNSLTVDGYDIGFWVNFLAAVAADSAIDGHVAAFAQFFEFPTRSPTCMA